jgi:hypothetical protein
MQAMRGISPLPPARDFRALASSVASVRHDRLHDRYVHGMFFSAQKQARTASDRRPWAESDPNRAPIIHNRAPFTLPEKPNRPRVSVQFSLLREIGQMNPKSFIIRILAAVFLVATATLIPSVGNAQMEKVKASMAALQDKTAKLGVAKLEGQDPVAGKDVPALYFGTTKMNNFFDVVDEVVKENGGTATLFVKAGDEYVRVATNVKKDDGSRAIGTILDPNGPAITTIKKDEPYYGEATILGKPYTTGYDPIKDASGSVIGIYYVGYVKQ